MTGRDVSQALEDGETAAGSSWTTAQLPEARALPHRTLLACITLTQHALHTPPLRHIAVLNTT